MSNENYYRDLFESIPEYKKIVLLIFLIQNDKDILYEVGFSENDLDLLNF